MDRYTQMRMFDDEQERITYYKNPTGYHTERARLNNTLTKYTEVCKCKEDTMNSEGWTATVRTLWQGIWLKRKSHRS